MLILAGVLIMDKESYKFKVAILGEPDIGKTTLNSLCTKHFDFLTEKKTEELYGVSFAVQILTSINIEITLVIWNFTGYEKYKKIHKRHIEGASGVLLAFDLTNKETFDKLPYWMEFIANNLPNVPIILMGTKADKFDKKEVPDNEIEEFFNNFKLQGYSEVSFLTGFNFEPTIKMLANKIYEYKILDNKTFTELKIKRFGNCPIILDESSTIEKISLTLDEIIKMISDEIIDDINKLKYDQNYLNEYQTKQRIDEIIKKIDEYDYKLEKLNEQIPIISSIFYNQINEWKHISNSFRKNLENIIK